MHDAPFKFSRHQPNRILPPYGQKSVFADLSVKLRKTLLYRFALRVRPMPAAVPAAAAAGRLKQEGNGPIDQRALGQ